MGLSDILWLAFTVAETVVVGLLIYRRIWRNFPVFFLYSIWTIVESLVAFVVFHRYPSSYASFYFGLTIVDYALLFGVLVELGWSIIRPLRASLSRLAPVAVGVFIVLLGAAIWPFATVPVAAHTPREIAGLMHMQQTFSILRVVVFLGLAAFSQLLSIGWRNRELQIATGLGFTSLVGLAVAMLHAHQSTWLQYSDWSNVVVVGYVCSLIYWIVSFSQQEQARREFSPQMQNVLLAVAGAARSTRLALRNDVPPEDRRP